MNYLLKIIPDELKDIPLEEVSTFYQTLENCFLIKNLGQVNHISNVVKKRFGLNCCLPVTIIDNLLLFLQLIM